MTMRFNRIILVAVLALSVATLPSAIGFAAGGKSMELSASTTMPDCDHHHHNVPSDQTQKTTDDGACMAACAVACFGFTATELASFTLPLPLSSALKLVRTSDKVSSRMGNLPFRPPRV